jgi:endonuclease YncB( thermonuclease family)
MISIVFVGVLLADKELFASYLARSNQKKYAFKPFLPLFCMNRKKIAVFLVFIISGVLYYYWVQTPVISYDSQVISVVDGDTVDLADGTRLRLMGINTPEKGQPLYGEARTWLEHQVLNKTIFVKVMGTEKYGRNLGYLFLDKENINEKILREGLAFSFYYEEDEYTASLLAAEERARKEEKNLWMFSPNRNCVLMKEFVYKEAGGHCSSGETLVLQNLCNKTLELTIKDDATHHAQVTVSAQETKETVFSCVFNNDGDSVYIYDAQGLLIFHRYG